MRGRLTAFWILLAAAVGFGLFHVKYKVQSLEDELARTNANIIKEEALLRVLHAEWSHLNRPNRIAELNARHLHLVPVTPEQIGTVDTLPTASSASEESR
jgi:hypothetical protein